MKFKTRSHSLSSNPIAKTEAGKSPNGQTAAVKTNGLKPINEQLEGISGGRDDEGHHSPPRK